jgi:hypothetical protein
MIARVVALALGLFAAVAASQGPEFAQQYRQRLGGALDELSRLVARFDADAAASGRTREETIARLAGNPDPAVRSQGEAMRITAERLEALRRQRAAMAGAGSFGRLLVLVREADSGLVRATYLDFEPAVPTTGEGVVAAGLGFLAVWGSILLLARAGRRLFLRRRRPPAAYR